MVCGIRMIRKLLPNVSGQFGRLSLPWSASLTLGRLVYQPCRPCISAESCHAQPVMLKRSYYESLGILVNAVLLRVLVDIENQQDISEEASHRLNELCQMLHDVEKLFMDGEDVSTPLHR